MSKSIADYCDENGNIDKEKLISLFNFPCENKREILNYLQSRKHEIFYSSASIIDVISSEKVSMPIFTVKNDDYIWDSEDIYYFEKYDMKLNEDFLSFIKTRL